MHRVALKIGISVACMAGVAGWLVAQIGVGPPVYAAAMGLVAGAGAYIVAAHLLGPRLERIGAVLNELLVQGKRDVNSAVTDGDEVDRLVRRSDQALTAVRKQVAELDRAERYRREYVGDVSHEIKTPVFAIQGFAETLLNGALDDRSVSRTFVEKILNHAHRLNALTRDLSEISALETGARKLSVAPFDAGQVMQEIRESFEIAAQQKDIDVRIHVDESARRVRADRDRIRQVLTNLVDNAVKCTNSGGWVEVRARQDAPEVVRLSVEDNGIGIERGDIDRITERFYRTEKSRFRNQGGTGLGLSIVKHILAAHGTSLSVESRVGEGSLFSFTLIAETTTFPSD